MVQWREGAGRGEVRGWCIWTAWQFYFKLRVFLPHPKPLLFPAFCLTSLVPNSLISWIIVSWHHVLTHSLASHQWLPLPSHLFSTLTLLPVCFSECLWLFSPLTSQHHPTSQRENRQFLWVFFLGIAFIPTALSCSLAVIPLSVLGSEISLSLLPAPSFLFPPNSLTYSL